MTERLMLDTETLGTEPGCAILSIGAVRFDENGLGEEFHRSISLESCQEHGLEVDASTLEWWLDQDDEAQAVLTDGDSLPGVLRDFKAFVTAERTDEVWAYSPSFDCTILTEAFDRVGFRQPWTFRDERDARTIAGLDAAVWPDRDDDTRHDALDDARAQARMVQQTLDRLEVTGDE